MHDPSTLVFDVRPLRLDVWHDEPGGADAGQVCGNPPMRTASRIAWTVRHWRHLHYRWWPYFRVRRWIVDRCADCGKRFRWGEGRHGYQSTDKVWHSVCMTLRHVQSHLDDLTAYVQCTADTDTRWRAEYRLNNLASHEGAKQEGTE